MQFGEEYVIGHGIIALNDLNISYNSTSILGEQIVGLCDGAPTCCIMLWHEHLSRFMATRSYHILDTGGIYFSVYHVCLTWDMYV